MVIGVEMGEYIKAMEFSSFFLLACGAVVRKSDALAGLEMAVKRCVFWLKMVLADMFYRLKFTDAFAFGAEHLISQYPGMWMISYADQVIIGGQPSKDAIGNLLYTSSVGTHTSVVYLNKQPGDGGITVSQFIWEHRSQRPNSYSYPIACPLCHHIHSWQNIPAQPAAAGIPFILKCKTVLEGGQRCTGTWSIPARPESSHVDNPYVGSWRKM